MYTGLDRINSDKFFTKKETVDICLSLLPKINKASDIIIEPSAGNGSFSKPLKCMYKNVIAMDIEPEDVDIIQHDFLMYEFKDILKPRQKIHCIGNPPFGRQSSLARKFIKHACSFCDTVSFILPKSFKKISYKKIFPIYFHLTKEIDIADNSYTINNDDYSVPCVFQVWEKRKSPRDIPNKIIPTIYKYVKKDENPDFAIRRVGFYAGSITEEWMDKNIQSHYFIKLVNFEKIKFLELFSKIKFDGDNTVGSISISKSEINVHIHNQNL